MNILLSLLCIIMQIFIKKCVHILLLRHYNILSLRTRFIIFDNGVEYTKQILSTIAFTVSGCKNICVLVMFYVYSLCYLSTITCTSLVVFYYTVTVLASSALSLLRGIVVAAGVAVGRASCK